jgi:hypothetical protein
MRGMTPLKKALCKLENWDYFTTHVAYGTGLGSVWAWNEVPFFKGQKKIVLRDAGLIDPEDIEEYIGVGGYSALHKALTQMTPDAVLEEVKNSKLRGRGGAGFPTAVKREMMKKVTTDKKYIICNADEGDPGVYMNRNEIESDPHALIEGMALGAYVMGAAEGIMYVRAEYPLAVQRFKKAVDDARERGLLGKNICDASLCGLGQTSSNPVLSTLRYFRDEYEKHIIQKRCKAGVCENLFMALCENSCPLHMNIPGYLQLLKEERIEEAFELTLRDNPLPGTVGRICYFHCMMRCRRDMLDEPVSQGGSVRWRPARRPLWNVPPLFLRLAKRWNLKPARRSASNSARTASSAHTSLLTRPMSRESTPGEMR